MANILKHISLKDLSNELNKIQGNDRLVNFNGMSTYLELLIAKRFKNHIRFYIFCVVVSYMFIFFLHMVQLSTNGF